jgi:polysaccharide export outer membrane protein
MRTACRIGLRRLVKGEDSQPNRPVDRGRNAAHVVRSIQTHGHNVRVKALRVFAALSLTALVGATGLSGCATCSTSSTMVQSCSSPDGAYCVDGQGICDAPRELRKVSLPDYVIEPPDVLLIETVNNIRPYDAPVRAGETLIIQVNRTIPLGQTDDMVSAQFKQINGYYVIGTDGYVNLGPEYGKVLAADQPLDEIQRRVDSHLRQILTSPQVLVTLPAPQNRQYVAGPHLVRTDGTVGLGIYGNVYVTGMTLEQARQTIEQHLSQHIYRPEVSVDVLAYNSKWYYVITDGGGAGEQVYKVPVTGNETVLDAMATINGLPSVASKASIWIARPSPNPCGPDQVLKVDWNGIAQGAQTATNYQMLPGDRLYVKASPLITFDTKLAKLTAPFERMFGFTILGNSTVRSLQGKPAAGF